MNNTYEIKPGFRNPADKAAGRIAGYLVIASYQRFPVGQFATRDEAAAHVDSCKLADEQAIARVQEAEAEYRRMGSFRQEERDEGAAPTCRA